MAKVAVVAVVVAVTSQAEEGKVAVGVECCFAGTAVAMEVAETAVEAVVMGLTLTANRCTRCMRRSRESTRDRGRCHG